MTSITTEKSTQVAVADPTRTELYAVIGTTGIKMSREFTDSYRYKTQPPDVSRPIYDVATSDEITHEIKEVVMISSNHIASAVLDAAIGSGFDDIEAMVTFIATNEMKTISQQTRCVLDDQIDMLNLNDLAWDRLSLLKDYMVHGHERQNWPVEPTHSEAWIAEAMRLGIPVEHLKRRIGVNYPGENDDAKQPPADAKVENIAPEKKSVNDNIRHVLDKVRDHNGWVAINGRFRDRTYNENRRAEQRAWLMENTTYGHFTPTYKPVTPSISDMSPEHLANIVMAYYRTGSVDRALFTIIKVGMCIDTTWMVMNSRMMGLLSDMCDRYPAIHRRTCDEWMPYIARSMLMHERHDGYRKITVRNPALISHDVVRSLPRSRSMWPDSNPYCSIIPSYGKKVVESMAMFCVGPRSILSMEEYERRMRYNTRHATRSDVPSVYELIEFDKYHDIVALSGGLHQSCVSTRPVELNYADWKSYYDAEYPVKLAEIKSTFDDYIALVRQHIPAEHIPDDLVNNRDVIRIADIVKVRGGHINAEVMKDIDVVEAKYHAVAGSVSDIDISVHTGSVEQYEEIVHGLVDRLKAAGYDNIYLIPIPRYNPKFAIMGADLVRPIDIYRIPHLQPVQLIRKFHFDAVRSYRITRMVNNQPVADIEWLWTAACAHLTGVNITMIWMSNNKSPLMITDTYTRRCFAKYSNSSMLKQYLEWCKDVYAKQGIDPKFIFAGAADRTHVLFSGRATAAGQKIKSINTPLDPYSDGAMPKRKWYSGNKVKLPNMDAIMENVVADLGAGRG